jgi:hypothetical protein
MIGYVDSPELYPNVVIPMLDVYPVTPIEIGLLDLENPDNLPQDNLPTGYLSVPVVAIPTIDVLESILQVIIPNVELIA